MDLKSFQNAQESSTITDDIRRKNEFGKADSEKVLSREGSELLPARRGLMAVEYGVS